MTKMIKSFDEYENRLTATHMIDALNLTDADAVTRMTKAVVIMNHESMTKPKTRLRIVTKNMWRFLKGKKYARR